MPPDFSKESYWTRRLRGETDGFEWLTGDSDPALTSAVVEAVKLCRQPQPRILHIGPGSSTVSLRLRECVVDPRQVLNVDFAASALELGSRWEREQWADSGMHMRWETADLLSFPDVEGLLGREDPSAHRFDVVVDKSTTDAVACGDDVVPHGDLAHRIRRHLPKLLIDDIQQLLHPILILALNVACVTKANASWVCLSYSTDRFPFLNASNSAENGRERPHESIENLTASLWRLHSKSSWEIPQHQDPASTNAHQPKICNWLYILRRTEVLL